MVVSRRAVLEAEVRQKREDAVGAIVEGSVLRGRPWSKWTDETFRSGIRVDGVADVTIENAVVRDCWVGIHASDADGLTDSADVDFTGADSTGSTWTSATCPDGTVMPGRSNDTCADNL